jgi:hypothetical protein
MTFQRLLMCATVVAFALIVGTSFAQDTGGGATVTSSVPAEATQTPTTPEGEEQPPEEQPDGEQEPSEEPTIAPPPEDGTAGGESTGALPQTGWRAFALASIGLGLLLAGLALRPTSSWPPPRDRLSRSTTPR